MSSARWRWRIYMSQLEWKGRLWVYSINHPAIALIGWKR